MKKIIALLLVAVMILGLAACAAKTETPKAEEPKKEDAPKTEEPKKEEAPAAEAKPFEGVELVLTVPILVGEAEDLAFWTEKLALFTEKTGAEVSLQQYTYGDLITSEMANLIAGEAPDILFLSGGSEYDFWSNGYLENLNDYFDADTASYWAYYDLKAMPDGDHYVVPFIGGACPRPITVNVDMAKELGIELPVDKDGFTWDYLIENAQKAVAAGKKGYISPFSGNENAIICNYFNYVKQAGGASDNEEGKWDFTSDAALKAMTFVYDMFNTYGIIDSVSYDMDATYASFCDGEALFSAGNVAWFVNNIDKVPFEIAMYQMRDVDGASFATADSFAINAASENKEAAAELIAYIMSSEVYMDALETLDPTQFDNVSTEIFAEYAPVAADLIDLTTTYWPPVAQGSAQIKETLQTHQQLCAMGEETPADALAAVQAVADEVQ